MLAENVNFLWSKYRACLPKFEKLSYTTMLGFLDRYEKLKYGSYGVYDELCMHSIKELLCMRHNGSFLNASECSTMLEYFCT